MLQPVALLNFRLWEIPTRATDINCHFQKQKPSVEAIWPQCVHLSGVTGKAWDGNSNLARGTVEPAEDAKSTEGIPAAGTADGGFHFQGNKFGMKKIERPASVLVAALDHNVDGFTDAGGGFDSGVAEVVESSQDVVMPKGGKGKTEPVFVDNFSSA